MDFTIICNLFKTKLNKYISVNYDNELDCTILLISVTSGSVFLDEYNMVVS